MITMIIHETPTYRLTGRRINDTLELFVCYPQAQHPREQRVIQLTLPDEARNRLARFCHATDNT